MEKWHFLDCLHKIFHHKDFFFSFYSYLCPVIDDFACFEMLQ